MRAIQQATLQVLARYGQRLTTTQVAKRAGVSVGTLYQYYADKNALLYDVLEQHVKLVTLAVEEACQANHGAPLDEMAEALVSAFLDAKLRDVAESMALYAAMDLPGAREIISPGRDRVWLLPNNRRRAFHGDDRHCARAARSEGARGAREVDSTRARVIGARVPGARLTGD